MTGDNTRQFKPVEWQRSEHEVKRVILTGPENRDLIEVVAAEDKLRLDKIRKDVATRLRKACEYLSDEDFTVLVEKIALVQLRAEHPSR